MEPEEVKNLTEALSNKWELYKKANDDRITAAETKAGNVAALEEKADKIDKEISDITKSLQDMNMAMNSFGKANAGGQEVTEKSAAVVEYAEKVSGYLRGGDFKRFDLAEFEAKGLSVDFQPGLGYTVPADMSGAIKTQIFETSPMRSLANVQTIGTASLEGFYDDNELDAGWVSERGARPETAAPEIGEWRIFADELYAMPKSTQLLLDDSSWNVEQWLSQKAVAKFGRVENAAFVGGDGDKKPRGILDYPASADPQVYERGSIGQFESAASGVISGDDMIDFIATLKTEWASRATLAANRRTWSTLRKLKDSTGQYLWQPSLQAGVPAVFNGIPTADFNDMPVIANGSLSVAIADFNDAYQIVDRMGMRIIRDELTEKGRVLFYMTTRVGGAVTGFDSIKLLKVKA